MALSVPPAVMRVGSTVVVCLGLFLAADPVKAAVADTNASPIRILMSEGTVEVLPAAKQNWKPAREDDVLQYGDQVRAGRNSRALVRLSDLSVLRVSELMTYELRAPEAGRRQPVLNLKIGRAYFFSRDKPQEIQLRTPVASGAIRGTEFNVEVAADGATKLTLLDGEVELANEQGSVILTSGQQGVVTPGQAPAQTAVINARNIIQWNLYYPAVLDPAELGLGTDSQPALIQSLSAYQSGDLPSALKQYPEGREPTTDAERIYLAELLLSVGLVEKSQAQLAALTPQKGPEVRLAFALRTLVSAVKLEEAPDRVAPELASEWLAESYVRQSQADLSGALSAARRAVEKSPDFAFGWERVAELEFGFGRTGKASEALERSLALASRNAQAVALKGFVLSAQNQISQALAQFDRAIALDGALANAWLGRGLCHIRRGESEPGRQDLEIAAALESNRALLRSYLGKAFNETGDFVRAGHELELARRLDPKDPTSWLYSALLHQQENRINEAIRDLENSEQLNDNRRVYRSRLLLDEDQAVRGANLANIYRDAGMDEVSLREATRAVNLDYANYSAHLYLADSYNQLRDPNQINLRYETPWLSEYLLANLLGPVGAGTLSQTVSQQDYSKLFEGDRLGVASSTSYYSRGAWLQSGAQYGTFGNVGYSIDSVYLSDPGWRPNNDQNQLTLSATVKAQIDPQDTVFFQATYYDASAGDLTEYYSQQQADTGLRTTERQQPLLLAGYHHEWSPGMHTLVLAGRFQDSLTVTDPQEQLLLLARDGSDQVLAVPYPSLPAVSLDYHGDLELYTAEVQQICSLDPHTLVVGARYQTGDFDTQSALGASSPTLLASLTRTTQVAFATAPVMQSFRPTMERVTGYAYDQWRLGQPLLITAGLTYDYLESPRNYRNPPIAAGEESQDRVSPKAGLTLAPLPGTVLRFAYTRSLGGVSFDQSARLEPSQVAGFNQAFRSLIPESVSGSLAGARFETFGLALDQKFPTGTYFGAQAELLKSDASRTLGAVDLTFPPPTYTPSGTQQLLDYEERDLLLTLNQLIGQWWSVGLRYQLSQANLKTTFPEIPSSVTTAGQSDNTATLHQVGLFGLFNHSSGFFGRAEALWYSQNNQGYQPALPGDNFWQLNLVAGYRFFHRHAQLELALLNVTDQDYRLNPLNLYQELPRSRTLAVSLQFTF